MADATTSPDQLRRACEILGLPVEGGPEALRARLLKHLEPLDGAAPVACLNPRLEPGSQKESSEDEAELPMLLCEWHIDIPFGRQAEVVAILKAWNLSKFEHTEFRRVKAHRLLVGHVGVVPGSQAWRVLRIVEEQR